MDNSQRLLAPLHRLLEVPLVYQLAQWFFAPTVRQLRSLIVEEVRARKGEALLDLGCGLGAYRPYFGENYTGIDINPAYIEQASESHEGRFQVMDCTQLEFESNRFDHVVTVATTHHLDDASLVRTVAEAVRVTRPGGRVHILDAILPPPGRHFLKRRWFLMDRGNYPREKAHLIELVASVIPISEQRELPGPMHDCLYLGLDVSKPVEAFKDEPIQSS
jgi:SAM-dependent methyltransferase